MTASEAIKELHEIRPKGGIIPQKRAEALDMAIQALEKVQQYRAIGTPEELKAAMKYVYLAKKHGTIGQVIENCVKYEEIGTAEECQVAMKKQTAKKPILKNREDRYFVDYANGYGEYKVTKWQDWVCPVCGWFVGERYNCSKDHSHDQKLCNYCSRCGQKLDWIEEE